MTTPDLSRLEPLDAFTGIEAPLSTLVAYSQAVSLKRIADLLSQPAETRVRHQGDVDVDLMVKIGEAPEPVRIENDKITPRVAASKALLTELPPKAVGQGFTAVAGLPVVDPVSGSPVDRNVELQVFFANGERRKAFAGSVAWRTPEGDAWRPIGFRNLGDGATVSSES